MRNPDNTPEPLFEVAEFGSFELFSPHVDATVWFFKDLLGMVETERSGDSVFLRGWEDPYKHTLKITERDTAGMGYAGWRTTSKQALERRVRAIEQTGLGRGWVEGECGVGAAYEFALPDGAVQRLNWEVDYYEPPEQAQSRLLNRVQRRPLTGVPIKAIDHLNLMAGDVTANKEFCAEVLGFRLSEHIVMSDDVEAGAWMRLQTRSHDVAFTKDATGVGGRLHHVAFLYGNSQHLNDACDVLTDHGLELEAGPAHHGISQAEFLYVFEPGGNRIELVGQLGYQVHDPSFEPITWKQDTLDNAIIWYGAPLPAEFDTYGTPNVLPTAYRTPNGYIAAEMRAIHGV
ncbi:VOC family protein [Herbiconiux sp. KACC 21604]|uniref:VOC family protein n=1 Tax=unclassified Herbiconiux TaxID=2618217 RepID=UPI001491AE56|nr:VOC family protein [Herbiconiux sp. SALV-R1]QJU55313.1 catechol 2,3-dioxygenase [Herbiconiux sp. SALV-R1]WPO86481.1 VOC family protein [Herbiconiux sp. KACC 21604]